jgi:TP901 family phage tail tape measure protein
MASKFNIVAELSLRGPKNLKPLVRNIQKQLQSVNIPVNVQVNANTQKALNKINSSMKGVQNSSKGMAQTATVAASNLAQVGSSGTKAAAGVSKMAKQSANASKQLKQTGDAALSAANKMKLFGEQAGLAVKRFAAFSIPTGIMIGFTTAISNGFREAIEFERELVKIAQVSGRTVSSLKGLTKEITRLATTFGVSSQELLETSRILAQTGMTAKETQTALSALAKASLAPTFKDMNDTVEASIAAMRQFGIAADQLESKLGAINAVAGSFAVEASDISFAIRRTGGAFKAAGGQLEELIALFTSVRSTTRESAETIATGFRTIFTRIQRPQTIAYLRELGVELQNTAGQFVGPMEAIKRLNSALANVPTTDPRFSQIVEQIGGYRQVSKVIPLITKYNETVKAYIVAQSGATSLAEDANKAQGALAVQIQKTKEEFSAFLRNLTQDNSIQDFAKNALQLARAFIKVADSAKTMLPLLASMAAFKGVFGGLAFARGFGQGLTNFGGSGGLGGQLGRRVGGGPAGGGGVGIAVGGGGGGARQTQSASRNTSALTANSTAINNLNNVIRTNLVTAINNLTNRVGAISMGVGVGRTRSRVSAGPMRQQKLPGFASGGVVGGQGTGDSVAAMLTPGEFVIKRSSAKSIGYSNLASMNEYASGGKVKNLSSGLIQRNIKRKGQRYGKKSGTAFKDGVNAFNPDDTISFTRTQDNNRPIRESDFKRLTASGKIDKRSSLYKDAKSYMSGNPRARGEAYERIMRAKGELGPKPPIKGEPFDGKKGAVWQEAKSYGEKKVTDRELADKAVRAALLGSNKIRKAKMTGRAEPVSLGMRVQAVKDNVQQSSSLLRKLLAEDTTSVAAAGKKGVRRARGGGISGSDTVPAMLTPGEYVINAKSARNIGYGALNAMNKGGTIKGFNKGGSVGVQKFNTGGQAGGQMGLLLAVALPTIVANFQAAGEGASDMAKGFADFTAKMTTAIMILTMMPRNFASGMGGMRMGGLGASASAFKGGFLGRRSPIMQAGVPVPREGSALAKRQGAYEKGRAARGTAAGAASVLIGGAIAATLSVMSENSRKASEATIEGARSMADAATAVKQANLASKQAGASTGSMIGGGVGGAILMSGLIANPIAAIVVAIGAAIVGGLVGWFASGDDAAEARKIQQEVRKKLVGDSSDAIRDAIGDVEAKRASFEAKSISIRENLLKNQTILLTATGKDLEEVQRQLRGSVSSLYSIGGRLVSSAKNIDDFEAASGGLGRVLIKQIALIRGISVEEVKDQFDEMITAQNNSKEAQIKLAQATRKVINSFRAFDLLVRRMDRTVHSLNNMANSLDRLTNTMFGEFGPYESRPDYDIGLLKNLDFTDIRDRGGFNASVASLVSPFGAEGEKIKNEASDMASAMSELPEMLKRAQAQYLASGKREDFGNVLTKIIGSKFGSLTDFIVSFIEDKLNTAEGESAFLSDVDRDPSGVVEGMLSGPSKNLASSISELASVTEAHAAALDDINAKRLVMENRMLRDSIALTRNRLAQERELRNLTGNMLTEREAKRADRREVEAIASSAGINLPKGGPAATRQFVQGQLIQARKDIADKEAELDRMGDKDPGRAAAASALNDMKIRATALGEMFKKLNDSSNEYINTLKQKIQTERRAAGQLQSGATQYAFGTDEQRQSMDIGAMYAMSGIPIDKVPSEYRGNVSSIYKSLSDVELAGFSQNADGSFGITAEEKNLFNKYKIGSIGGRATGDMNVGDRRTGRAKELYDTYNFLKGRGFDEETAAKIAYAGATTKEEKLINSLQGYLNKQQVSQEQFLKNLGAILRQGFKERQEREDRKRDAEIKAFEANAKAEESRKEGEKKKAELDTAKDRFDNVNAVEESIRLRGRLQGRDPGDIKDPQMEAIIKGLQPGSGAANAYAAYSARVADSGSEMMRIGVKYGTESESAFDAHRFGALTSEDYAVDAGYTFDAAGVRRGFTPTVDSMGQRLSDFTMKRFTDDYRGILRNTTGDYNKMVGESGFNFARPSGVVTAEQASAANTTYQQYAQLQADEIAKMYGLDDDAKKKLVNQISDHMFRSTFNDRGDGTYGYDEAAFSNLRSRGLAANRAYLEQTGYGALSGVGEKDEKTILAYNQERDALSRNVFQKNYGDLDARSQQIIDDAFKSSMAAPELFAKGLEGANTGIGKLRTEVEGLILTLGLLKDIYNQQVKERAAQRAVAKYGDAPDGEYGYDTLMKPYDAATGTGVQHFTVTDPSLNAQGQKEGKTYYDPPTGKFYKVTAGKVNYLSKGGMLGAFQPEGKDKIPAMLAKGEAVLTPEQMGKLGITGKSLKAAGVPTVYASGGVVLGGAPSAGGVSTLDDTNRILISILDELKRPSISYFNEGGSIFKPKGTDTVPAMLTPGEFVIKKSSVDKYGSGMLGAINAGYYNEGGMVDRLRERKRIRKDIRGKQEAVEDRYRIDQFKQSIADGTVSNRGYDSRFGMMQSRSRRNMSSTRFFNDGGPVYLEDGGSPSAASYLKSATPTNMPSGVYKLMGEGYSYQEAKKKYAELIRNPLPRTVDPDYDFVEELKSSDHLGEAGVGHLLDIGKRAFGMLGSAGDVLTNVGLAARDKMYAAGYGLTGGAGGAHDYKVWSEKSARRIEKAGSSLVNLVTADQASRSGFAGFDEQGLTEYDKYLDRQFGDYAKIDRYGDMAFELGTDVLTAKAGFSAADHFGSLLNKIPDLSKTKKIYQKKGMLSLGPKPPSPPPLKPKQFSAAQEDRWRYGMGYDDYGSNATTGWKYHANIDRSQSGVDETIRAYMNEKDIQYKLSTQGGKFLTVYGTRPKATPKGAGPIRAMSKDEMLQQSQMVGSDLKRMLGDSFLPPSKSMGTGLPIGNDMTARFSVGRAYDEKLHLADFSQINQRHYDWKSGRMPAPFSAMGEDVIQGVPQMFKPTFKGGLQLPLRSGYNKPGVGYAPARDAHNAMIKEFGTYYTGTQKTGGTGVNLYSGFPMPSKEQLKKGWSHMPFVSKDSWGRMFPKTTGHQMYGPAKASRKFSGKGALKEFGKFGAIGYGGHLLGDQLREPTLKEVDVTNRQESDALRNFKKTEYGDQVLPSGMITPFYKRRGGMVGFNRERGEGLGQKKRWREEQARKAEQEALRRAEEIRKEGEQQAKKQQPLKPLTEAEMYPDAHAAFRDGRYAEGLKIMRDTPGARGSQLYGNLYKSWYFKNFKELEGKHDPSMSPQEIDDMYDKRDRYLANEQWARENYHSDIPTPMPHPLDQKERERVSLGGGPDGYRPRLEDQHPSEIGKPHTVEVDNMKGGTETVPSSRLSIDPRLTLDGREHMNYRIRTGEQTSEDYKKFIAPFKPTGSRIYLDHIPLNPDKSMSNVSDGHIRYAIALSGTTEMPDPMSVIYNPKQRGFIAKRSEYYSQTSGKILPLPTGFSHVANPIDYYDSLVDRYGFSTLKNWHQDSLQGKNRFGIKGPLLPSGYWKYDENGNITGLGGGYYQDGGEKPKYPPRRPGSGAFPDYHKQRLQKYSRWNTKGGKSIMAKPIAYKDGWVNFDLAEAFDGQKFAAWPIHDFVDEDNKALNAMKNKNFDPEQFFMGGKVTPWATNPAMLGMIMRMYGSPKGLRGAGNKGLVKSKDYYTKVDDKDAFIDPLTGKKTIHKGAIERRQKYHMGRNKRMYAAMKGRNPMMTTGTKEYQRWVKNPDFDPTQPKGAGNEMFLPRDQVAAVSGRMPLLETLDKSVPGNATALQQEVFRGMHVDYGKGDRFNAAQRARLTRRVDGSFGRLLQTGLFTSAGSIENLNLTRDNADWVYRLLKKAPMSADMAEIRMAYRRVMNYKGKLGGQAVKPFYDPYEVSGDKNITGNKDATKKDTTNWSDFNDKYGAHAKKLGIINKDYAPEPSRYNTGGLQNVEPGPVVKDPAWRPPAWSGPYPPGLEGITPKMWAGGEGPHGGTLDWRLDQLDFHHPAYANEIRKWLKPDTAGFGGEYNQYWSRGGKILGLNDGGSVPGVGNTDSIPAMLTPGEYVVNAQSAGKHAALLRAINNGNGSTAYLNDGGQAGGGSSSGGSFGGFSLGGFGAAADKIKQAMSVLTSVSPMFASFTAAAEMINNALSGFSVGTPIQHIHSHTFSGSVNIDIVGMDITDEIESRLRSVGTDMVNAQLISVLKKMGEEEPSTIAARLEMGGTNAGS